MKELSAYDKNDRQTTLIHETSAGTKLITITSAWDAVGRKTVEAKNGTPTTYSYDDADRLAGQQVSSGFATISYDAVGNILVKAHQGANSVASRR